MSKGKGTVPYLSLPDVLLVGVDVYRCPNCGEEDVVIPRLKDLNQLLVSDLLETNSLTFSAAEACFLRKYLGLSADQLCDHLGVSEARVLEWERGDVPLTKTEAAALRLLVARSAPAYHYQAPNPAEPSKPKTKSWHPTDRTWEPSPLPA